MNNCYICGAEITDEQKTIFNGKCPDCIRTIKTRIPGLNLFLLITLGVILGNFIAKIILFYFGMAWKKN